MRSVPQIRGSFPNQTGQLRIAGGLALDVEIPVADHVDQDESFYLREQAVLLPAGGEMLAPVYAVSVAPFADGFFTVEKHHVHVVDAGLVREHMRQFEEQAGGRSAVVRAYEFAAGEELGVEVAGDDDRLSALAWKFRDDVFHRHGAFGSGRGEGIVDQIAVLLGGRGFTAIEVKLRNNVGLQLAIRLRSG